MLATYRNPVLPGFHPDPSVCRVGTDFYLVTSTFEYFPGLPVHHSKDLVHWRQLGHVLDRPGQLVLDGVRPSGGLYAPTIRHHDGRWFVVCTLVDGPGPQTGNFVVTATSPHGPWSDPVWLPEADGIDPSLFFDTDGTCWYTATRPVDPEAGRTEIWLQRFDPDGPALTGERHVLWSGALTGARWAEAPHLYRVAGRYVLVIAEGGTGRDHAVTVARSDRVTGPYTGYPRNPVLTHRHLGRDHPVQNVGHADLVQTPDGAWWAVVLGVRQPVHGFHPLGRETFLAPVSWEDGWPVGCAGLGRLPCVGRAPELPEHPWPVPPDRDDFDGARPDVAWSMLRTPHEQWWDLTGRPGHLRLALRPAQLGDRGNPSLLVRRQQHHDFRVRALVDLEVEAPAGRAGGVGGLVLMASEDDHLRLVVEAAGTPQRAVRLIRRRAGQESVLATAMVPEGPLLLELSAQGRDMVAGVAPPSGAAARLGGTHDITFLGEEPAQGFTGAMVGLYASAEGGPPAGWVDIDWFEYVGLQDAQNDAFGHLDQVSHRP